MQNYTYLKDCKNKKEITEQFFDWLFDKPNIDLSYEIDFTLASSYDDPYIYYPKQIADFFETNAMQRLHKVSQLGSVIKMHSNCYHNRLDHSKGTYNRKLEELIYQMQDASYRKYIEDNNLKLYLIAELIKEAAHDIGHLPLSHVMETTIVGKRGFHEDIGKKILLEDFEIQELLLSISPELPKVLNESLSQDILNFQTHDESNYDVDRLDYLIRDALYLGNPIDFKVEPYEILFAKTDDAGNILKSSDGSIMIAKDLETSKTRIDVYNSNNLQDIENFLNQRLTNYRNTYFSPENQVLDTSISCFLNQLLHSEAVNLLSPNFRNLIEELKSKKLDEISVENLTKFNDLTFYSEVINIAENSSDTNMREFATLVLPSLNSLMDFIYSSLNMTKESKKSDFSQEELDFITKIKYLIHSNSKLSTNLKDKNFFNLNSVYCRDSQKIKELTEKWQSFVHSNSLTVKAYKCTDPIYIKDKTGKIFTLDNHPNRTCDWKEKSETITCAFAFIPELRLNGVDEITIQEIINDFNGFKPIHPQNFINANMSLLQVGHSMESYFDELEI